MNTTTIATHLNVLESAITKTEEWANVLFVVVKGLGARFVSKKVMGTEKTGITGRECLGKFVSQWNDTHGSEWNSKAGGFVTAKVWDKKEGELRVYFSRVEGQSITLRDRGDSQFAIVSIPTKYDLDESIKPILHAIAADFKVVTLDRVLMQEDEDGIIAPQWHHEPGVHIVREWWK